MSLLIFKIFARARVCVYAGVCVYVCMYVCVYAGVCVYGCVYVLGRGAEREVEEEEGEQDNW